MYRSDSAEVPAASLPADLPPVAPDGAQSRVNVAAHEQIYTTPPPPQQRGWIQSGLYVMALPMAMTVGIMLAPAIWMFRLRPRQ